MHLRANSIQDIPGHCLFGTKCIFMFATSTLSCVQRWDCKCTYIYRTTGGGEGHVRRFLVKKGDRTRSDSGLSNIFFYPIEGFPGLYNCFPISSLNSLLPHSHLLPLLFVVTFSRNKARPTCLVFLPSTSSLPPERPSARSLGKLIVGVWERSVYDRRKICLLLHAQFPSIISEHSRDSPPRKKRLV